MLEIRVGSKRKAFLVLASRIKADEVACYILELAFGLFFETRPVVRTQTVDFRWHTILAAVFRKLVKGMKAHEGDVVVGIHKLDKLLYVAADLRADKPAEPTDAVVDMNHVVADLDLAELFKRQRHLARPCTLALERVFVEAVEYLVVSEHTPPGRVVYKSLVKRVQRGCESDVVAAVFEDYPQAVKLLFIVAEDIDGIPLRGEALEIIGDDVEVFVIDALRRTFEIERPAFRRRRRRAREMQTAERRQLLGEGFRVDNLFHRAQIAFISNQR